MADQHFSAPVCAQPAVPRAGVTHVRYRHTERFTVVGNHLAQHRDLSLTAIGLGLYIQSLPDGARIGIKFLVTRFPEGEITIARALRELEAHGYLIRKTERTALGRRVTRTTAYDNPQAQTQVESAAPRESAVSSSVPEQPAKSPQRQETDAHRRAADVLASLRGREPRLLLSGRDVHRLAPALSTWLERGISSDAAVRTLTADIPADPIRHPAAFLSYRLTNWLPPALPAPAPSAPPAAPKPYPFQTCDDCDRAFRGPDPGRCRDCGGIPPGEPSDGSLAA